jgi:hypothetical protein
VNRYKQRPSPVTVVAAARWFPQSNVAGVTLVPAVGDVPAHGLIHGNEGDTVVNQGDFVIINETTGATTAQAPYTFIANYEPTEDFG